MTEGKLTHTEQAYLAGVIESKGDIVIFRTEPNDRALRRIELTLSGLHPAQIKWIRERFVSAGKRGGDSLRFVTSLGVSEVLIQAWDYLTFWKSRAQIAFKFHETRGVSGMGLTTKQLRTRAKLEKGLQKLKGVE